MVKRNGLVALLGVTLLLLVSFTTSFIPRASGLAHASGGGAVSTIKGLHSISVVGSTQFILDAKGQTISVDANPYGVAIAPSGTTPGGTLHAGDIVVTNFGATGTGTTLVRFPQKAGPGHLYNTGSNSGVNGPVAEAFNPTGNDWIANSNANNVEILDTSGNLAVTITSPLFNKPWGQAFNGGVANPKDGSVAAFFSTNAADGTLDRIDIIPNGGSVTFKVYQIGQLGWTSSPAVATIAPQGMAWVSTWYWAGNTYQDVLFVNDPANNRIAAYPNSSTINTSSKKSTDKGITVFKGKPLNTAAGLAINPINGDILVVNQLDNNIVELNPSTGTVVGTRTLDNVPVNPSNGTGSALFGLAATTDSKGNLVVYFTDDLTNTLDMLSV